MLRLKIKRKIYLYSLFYSLLFLLTICNLAPTIWSLECEYYNSTECKNGNCNEHPTTTVSCGQDEPSKVFGCFTLWQKGLNDSTKEVLQFKGCFLNNKQCVGQDTCVEKSAGRRTEKQTSTTLFCCCSKDYCNREYSWDPAPTTTTVKPKAVDPPSRSSVSSILVFTLVPIFCTVFFLAFYYIHRRLRQKPLTALDTLTDEENILLEKSESNYALPITLVEVKASGRFGHVWKASMAGNNSYVAVKILPLRERASWKLEQEVYSLPLMCDSEFILRFIGARNCAEGDNLQLWLISEYLEYGSLYDYLKGNILTWSDLLKVAVTMCKGLAFLHDEIDAEQKGKGYKPAVAHRDFKSKNVLLRQDLTACVADFGLAHIFYHGQSIGTNHGQVGTRRYMAPEVLEGAVSFTRDNFQRIDMYACGLVLWELASRCNAQQSVGDYRLPFEEFIGQQPSLEEMQDVVVTQRKRPTCRNDWYSHPGMAILVEAMKDAWDQKRESQPHA